MLLTGASPTLPNPRGDSCLEAVRSTVPHDGELTVQTRDLGSLRGRLRNVNLDTRLLYLEVYEPRTSRFLHREIPGADIESVQYHRQTRNWMIPVLSGAALGGAALALGLGFDSLDDLDDENLWVGMTIIGTVVGFVGGLVIAPSTTTVEQLDCDTP